jgi:hypothetical protein
VSNSSVLGEFFQFLLCYCVIEQPPNIGIWFVKSLINSEEANFKVLQETLVGMLKVQNGGGIKNERQTKKFSLVWTFLG